MTHRFFLGISALLAFYFANNFSFKKFEKNNFSTTIVQDTIKPDSTLAIIDSLSIEEGLYNYKLYKKSGVASYYANKFNGKRTASGERFNNDRLTAAHRKLPFGTKVRVTNIRNGRKIIVKINDRGPHVRSREIDLSRKAFMYLAHNKGGGEMKVKLEVAIKK